MMKAVQTKAAAMAAKINTPFFNKAEGQNLFNSTASEQPFFSQKNSFFKTNNHPVQTKLTVGKPNDVYEKEADATADKVVQRLSENAYQNSIQRKPDLANSITPLLQTKCVACEKEDKLQKKEEIDDRDPLKNKVQAKSIFESNEEKPKDEKNIQRKCDACEKEDKEKLQKKDEKQKLQDKLQTKSIFESNEEKNNIQRKCADCEKEEKLQKKPETHSDVAPANVESNLNASKNSGSRLPNNIRSQMENSFGADFSNVRIHNDSAATKMSRDLNAQAFTHGSDIYFNTGKYDTNSSSGKHLLAHELTHTVQQQGAIRKKSAAPKTTAPAKKITDADKDELENASLDKGDYKGYFTIVNKKIEIHLKKLLAKKYLEKDEHDFLDKNVELPSPKEERKTRQIDKWKTAVRVGVNTQLEKISKNKDPKDDALLLTLDKAQKKGAGLIGTIKEILEEVMVPFWTFEGNPKLYDVEHVIDWQIAGQKADDIRNLILLDRSYNRSLGTEVKDNIHKHLTALAKHYQEEFSGVPDDAEKLMGRYKIIVDDFNYKPEKIDKDKILTKDEVENLNNAFTKQTPYKDKNIEIKDAVIPKDHFLLKTTDARAGYLLPYDVKEKLIGSWLVTTEYDKKTKKLKTLIFEIAVKDKKKILAGDREIEASSKKIKSSLAYEELKKDVYQVNGRDLRQQFGAAFKELYGEVKVLSPIVLDEINTNGFDVSVKGRVVSTLSFLKDVNITFYYENGVFGIEAEIPLNAIAEKIPKPFKVTSANLVISANSEEGLSFFGDVQFILGKFGTGEISAGISSKTGLFFTGTFTFDEKYFKALKAITVEYKNGKWNITGTLGVNEGTIKGVKEATLTIGYTDEKFSANGHALLTIPGIEKVDLSAEFNEKGEFAFAADVTLGKLPGIKSGEVKVWIKTKEGEEGIKVSAAGKAAPDFPAIPELNTEFAVLYDDGVFDVKATVTYAKGRFTGTVQIGVTNKAVDEKGKPQGETAPEKGPVIVYGYGELTVVLWKDNKGTVTVRLTPEKEVLVGGIILLKDLKPFGDGYHFNKELIPFPEIKIPLVGLPGLSISAFINGGVYFKFDWDPLVLKELKVELKEINVNDIENANLDIHGSIGSVATAELYMVIRAGLEAQALIAKLKGSIGGEAGVGITAEAGGELDATFNKDKGLQFKEVRAFMNVTPKAVFRLTGEVSVDLDLWFTEINLYYHKWIFADKELDISGLSLKVDFPIQFGEDNTLIPPEVEKMNLQKPEFTGEKGKEVLDDAINGDSKKELEQKKNQIRQDIRADLLKGQNDKDFSPSEYVNKMKEKYEDNPDMQAFVLKSIEEESSRLAKELYEQKKNEIRNANIPLSSKLALAQMYVMWNQYVTQADFEAFKMELIQADEEKRKAATQNQAAANVPLNTLDNASPVPASANNNNPQNSTPAVQKKEIKNQYSANENFENNLTEDSKASVKSNNQLLNHLTKQNNKNVINKKAEVDTAGNYTGNYIFNPGHDGLNLTFFNHVKHNVADGTLDDAEITALRADAIARNGTVMHVELLLMAAMRNPVNVTLMQAHTTGSLIIPMSQIRKADEDYLTNFGRKTLPDEIAILNLRLLAAKFGLTVEKPEDVELELSNKAQKYIMQYAAKQFADQADKLVIDAEFSKPKVPLTEIMIAMLNGAADSTPGDRVMAGTVYSIARKANHPMANKILSGALLVDALIPSVYKRIAGGGDASYQYSTDADVLKSDTLYVPTSLDIFQLADRALVIHELTHAADDFATTGRQQIDSLKLETHAYKEQGKYMMDQILADPTATGFVNTASQYTHSGALYYWAMVAAAKDDTTRYENVLVQINSAAPMSKSAADIRADLGLSVTALNTRVRNELLAYRDAGGHQLYFAGTTNVEGEAGHYFH